MAHPSLFITWGFCMKIEIKPETIERIEKIGEMLTDVAINEVINLIKEKRNCQSPNSF